MDLHYFSEGESKKQLEFQKVRDKTLYWPVRLLQILGITPNLVTALSFLAILGFAWIAVSAPYYALAFLAAHVIFDGFDGVLARLTNTQSKSGALLDMLNDHTGMVVMVGALVYHALVDPTVALLYVYLYTVMIGLIVVRNTLQITVKFVFRSKYFLYGLYALWVFASTNLFYEGMLVFSALMVPTVLISITKIMRHLDT